MLFSLFFDILALLSSLLLKFARFSYPFLFWLIYFMLSSLYISSIFPFTSYVCCWLCFLYFALFLFSIFSSPRLLHFFLLRCLPNFYWSSHFLIICRIFVYLLSILLYLRHFHTRIKDNNWWTRTKCVHMLQTPQPKGYVILSIVCIYSQLLATLFHIVFYT